MKSKIVLTQREYGGKVEITTSDGYVYRITVQDGENLIRVQTVDGGMIILPSVSNEVRIRTNTD